MQNDFLAFENSYFTTYVLRIVIRDDPVFFFYLRGQLGSIIMYMTDIKLIQINYYFLSAMLIPQNLNYEIFDRKYKETSVI